MKTADILMKKENLKMFAGFFTLIFIGLFAIAYAIQIIPNELVDTSGGNSPIISEEVDEYNEFAFTEDEPVALTQTKPSKIEIPRVGINVIISHPASPSVEVLDNALLKGAVYYPGSGTIEKGNMFIFGHSTGLKVVRNQAFKAFNNLKNVSVGDLIYITGEDGKTYQYKAISVDLVDENEALVQFDTSNQMITISTCNTFGEKQERHVVKGEFMGEVVI